MPWPHEIVAKSTSIGFQVSVPSGHQAVKKFIWHERQRRAKKNHVPIIHLYLKLENARSMPGLFKGEAKFGKSGRITTEPIKFWVDLVFNMSRLVQCARRLRVSK